jgi:hypothetical protein
MLPRVTAVVGSGACWAFSQAAIATTADAAGTVRTGYGFGWRPPGHRMSHALGAD